MCKDKNLAPEPAARTGRVLAQLSSNVFLVDVPGVGSIVATDYSRQARPGQGVSVVKVGGGWGIT